MKNDKKLKFDENLMKKPFLLNKKPYYYTIILTIIGFCALF